MSNYKPTQTENTHMVGGKKLLPDSNIFPDLEANAICEECMGWERDRPASIKTRYSFWYCTEHAAQFCTCDTETICCIHPILATNWQSLKNTPWSLPAHLTEKETK